MGWKTRTAPTLGRKIVRGLAGFAVGFLGALAMGLVVIQLTAAVVGERPQPRGLGWLLLPVVGGSLGVFLFLPQTARRQSRKLARFTGEDDRKPVHRGWYAPGVEDAVKKPRKSEPPPLAIPAEGQTAENVTSLSAAKDRRRAANE